MNTLAIIGGTGLDTPGILHVDKREVIHTPFGEPSGPLARGSLFGQEVLFYHATDITITCHPTR